LFSIRMFGPKFTQSSPRNNPHRRILARSHFGIKSLGGDGGTDEWESE
jgi:hypothetical protein